ncbi:hypothetical protein Tco_0312332 [Tanacetum coccineum]
MGKKDEEIASLQAQLLLKEAEAAEAIHLRSQASALEVAEKSPWEEIDVLKERNSALEKERDSLDAKERNSALEKERDSLDAKVTESQATTANKVREVVDLNSIITFIKSYNDELVDQVARYEHLQEAIEAFQDAQIKIMEDKLAKLETKVVEAVLYLEETFCPCILTTIAGQRWLLTHGMKLIIVKCLNSLEYLFALGAFIGRAIEKGMQAGLAAGINHGKEGRSLADVVAYTPFTDADYDTAMQQFHDVNFSLLSEQKSCKDISVEEVMNVLRLESPLIDLLGMKPLSVVVLNGAKVNSGSLPTPVATTTALSTTFATTISIVPISTDDYEVVDAKNVQRNDTSFPNFEEETLNATL